MQMSVEVALHLHALWTPCLEEGDWLGSCASCCKGTIRTAGQLASRTVQTQLWTLWSLAPHRTQTAITETNRITILTQLPQISFYRIFRPITRALSIQKGSKIVKNEHARYTLERFPTDNARVIRTKKVSDSTLCIKHNFQLKLVCSVHSVALLNITLFKSKKFFIGLYIERIIRV